MEQEKIFFQPRDKATIYFDSGTEFNAEGTAILLSFIRKDDWSETWKVRFDITKDICERKIRLSAGKNAMSLANRYSESKKEEKY